MNEEFKNETLNIKRMVLDLRKALENFDKHWTIFEKVFFYFEIGK